MIRQLNLVVLLAITSEAAWQKIKSLVTKDEVCLPILCLLGMILLWWSVAMVNHELMLTPPEVLIANIGYILNPFYQRKAGNLVIGWLLITNYVKNHQPYRSFSNFRNFHHFRLFDNY
jgi:nitrate/nitrite transport system permease protein